MTCSSYTHQMSCRQRSNDHTGKPIKLKQWRKEEVSTRSEATQGTEKKNKDMESGS